MGNSSSVPPIKRYLNDDTGQATLSVAAKTQMPSLKNTLVIEVVVQIHHIADFGGDPYTIDWIAIFKNVLGARKGHVRGIRPKPSSELGTSAPSQWQLQSQTP
ncbi:unnamed protein product [Lactuca saligna]|uniref:Uncharacterized protein n=1 Tax=Lactuca saligna TaxID=75948 RepID=A0AA35ZMC6_LACSI|nr:unnamed protein product [Lactuca saligna]